MVHLAQFLQAGLVVWLVLLSMLIAVRALRGDIRCVGFLASAPNSQSQIAPERVVSIVVFPFVITMYVLQALGADLTVATGGRPTLPEVPDYLMSLLVGGNGLYLAGKIMRRS